MIEVKDYIESLEGRDYSGTSNSTTEFVSTIVNTKTDDAQGTPIKCTGSSVKLRDLGGYIMLDLTFTTSESVDMRMIYNYLEKYGNDLSNLTEESYEFPEVAFFITSNEHEGYYILLANPLFWSWNTSTRVGEYDTIRILFEEDNYGFFKETE